MQLYNSSCMFKPSAPFKGPSSLSHIWSIIQNRFNHTFPFTCSNHLLHSGFCPHSCKYPTLPFGSVLQTVTWCFHSRLVTRVFRLCASRRLTYVCSVMCTKMCVFERDKHIVHTRLACIYHFTTSHTTQVHIYICVYVNVYSLQCTSLCAHTPIKQH